MTNVDTEEYKLGNFRVSNINENEFKHHLSDLIQSGKACVISYANAHTCCLTTYNSYVKEINELSGIVLLDGYSIILAGKLLGKKFKTKLALTNLDNLIAEVVLENNAKLYFLGAEEGVAKKAAFILKQKFPGVNIVGTYHGFFDHEEEKYVLDSILQAKANIIVVGMGSPRQDVWYLQNRRHLQSTTCILGGQCLEYWAGLEPPPPPWMSRNGLAWLYRTIRHPIKMLPRYFKVIPHFIYLVIKLKLLLYCEKKNTC